MSTLNPSMASEVLAAIQANAADIAQAYSRALDGPLSHGAAESASFAERRSDATLAAPGLLTLVTAGELALAIVLPESSRLLPAWAAVPDAAGQGKLAALSDELAQLVLPRTVEVTSSRTQWVPSLAEALARGAPRADATSATLEIVRDNAKSHLLAIWPLMALQDVYGNVGPEAVQASPSPARSAEGNASSSKSLDQLPGFSRSLLKIRLPVSVHLASKRECVQEIVEIVPGSIIKFDKGCDELLHMVVGGQRVAEGEAVKVGDKFGFRVSSMLLPREHFVKVQRRRAG